MKWKLRSERCHRYEYFRACFESIAHTHTHTRARTHTHTHRILNPHFVSNNPGTKIELPSLTGRHMMHGDAITVSLERNHCTVKV